MTNDERRETRAFMVPPNEAGRPDLPAGTAVGAFSRSAMKNFHAIPDVIKI
jgi:hypothetical protein